MGVSIIQGWWTTVLGVLVLAAASSNVFRTFFWLIFATSILSIAHGVFLLPVLLRATAVASEAILGKPTPSQTSLSTTAAAGQVMAA